MMQSLPQSPVAAVQEVLRAACFAAERHSTQKRKGAAAEPYVNHLLEVAHLVATALDDPDTNLVKAALLHDTIEDAHVLREELAEKFGPDVADLVAEVTDDKSLKKEERKRLQIENAPKKSPRAAVIKLADKIANLRSILNSPPVDWTFERRREYFKWARNVVDRLPNPNPKLKRVFFETFSGFMGRDYYGLPVTLEREDPKAVDGYHRSGSRGDYEVGRFGLTVKIVDSDPYYDGLIYQHGKPVAVVHCLGGKEGIVRGLAEDDPETLNMVFGIDIEQSSDRA